MIDLHLLIVSCDWKKPNCLMGFRLSQTMPIWPNSAAKRIDTQKRLMKTTEVCPKHIWNRAMFRKCMHTTVKLDLITFMNEQIDNWINGSYIMWNKSLWITSHRYFVYVLQSNMWMDVRTIIINEGMMFIAPNLLFKNQKLIVVISMYIKSD